MGHIVNPIVYRLSKTKFWKNSWMFFVKKNYRLLLLEDLNFDKFVNWFVHSIDWFSFQTQIFKSKIVRYSKCFFLNIFFLKDNYSPYKSFSKEIIFVPTYSSIFFKYFLKRHVYKSYNKLSRCFLKSSRFKVEIVEDEPGYRKFYKKYKRAKVKLNSIFKDHTFFNIEWWKRRGRRFRKLFKIIKKKLRWIFSHDLKSINYMSIARGLKGFNRRRMFFFRDLSRDYAWFRWRRHHKFHLLYFFHKYRRRYLHTKLKYIYNCYSYFSILPMFRYKNFLFKNNFKVLLKPRMLLSTKLNLRRGAFTHYLHLDLNTSSFFNYFRKFLIYFLKKIFYFRIFKVNLIPLSKFYHETSYLRKLVRMRVYQGFRVPHYLKKLYWKLRKKKKLVVGMRICLAGRYMKRLRNRKIRLDFGSFKPSNINTPISHTNFIILLKQGICGVRFTLLLKTKLNEITKKTTLNLASYK